ncbi:MAG TPA: AmmeMemoRadiSam system protein A [Candidatus Acidoferrum sp.]|nr:AmmeMemoRadiSam system protein A [Candidatus Acidoferrum sp.]
MPSFADSEKRLFLDVARRSLILAVENNSVLTDLPDHASLRLPGGAFVTLRIRRRLRGCIGRLPSVVMPVSYVEAVASSARAAALEDPRFSPVSLPELPQIDIEISLLSPLFDISPEAIVPGLHGLLVSHGPNRGVLLPQVATEFRWPALRFLEETCVKAGLDQNAWKEPGTRTQAFTAEVFSESELVAGKSAEPANKAGSGKPYSIST